MKNLPKSRHGIFLIGIIMALLMELAAILGWNVWGKWRYHNYVRNYVKSAGVAERTFEDYRYSLSLDIGHAESGIRRIPVEDDSADSITCEVQKFWSVNSRIINLTGKPYTITELPIELDYLVDGKWYHCSGFDSTEIKFSRMPENRILEPREAVSVEIPIHPPVRKEGGKGPYDSGKFWYGRYRLVLEWEEGEYVYLEFDFPEKGYQGSGRLYSSKGH